MRTLRPCLILPFLLAALLGGCGPEGAVSLEELLEEDALAGESEEGKADSYSSTSTYVLARPDHRKCMAPLCGGFFLRRANRATIKCGDGGWASECYVAEVDLAKLKLGAAAAAQVQSGLGEERGVLRGSVVKSTIAGKSVDRFVAKEAWLAPAAGLPPPSDTFFRGSPSGIVCIKAPCPTIHVAKLNSTIAANIVEPDLGDVPGTKKERAGAAYELTHSSLILAGHPDQASLAPSQVYRRALP